MGASKRRLAEAAARVIRTRVVLKVILLFSLVDIGLGWLAARPLLTVAGLGGLGYVVGRFVLFRRKRTPTAAPARPEPPRPVRPKRVRKAVDPGDRDALARQMLDQGRYALLLRPQIAPNLSEGLYARTLQTFQEQMALVPDGEVVIGQIETAGDDVRLTEDEILRRRGRVVAVQRFFLDRYPVTNRQYDEFVAAGGYQDMALWDPSVLPALLDFVDRTGHPGPRYWEDGGYPAGQDDLPVVGVCWYEAAACARWLGKRLPTDAEWVKAGAWPVTLSENTRMQRRFPWGDTMDRTRANVWGSGVERIVPVTEFADGVSVGGVYQLVGNVWEWTGGNYRPADHSAGELTLLAPLKNIRGGAFDTYFANQATCQFHSGENPLSRRHNIGFRCAVGMCDLRLSCDDEQSEKAAEGQALPLADEVPA